MLNGLVISMEHRVKSMPQEPPRTNSIGVCNKDTDVFAFSDSLNQN